MTYEIHSIAADRNTDHNSIELKSPNLVALVPNMYI